METYKKDQEYTLKVANTDNEIKEIKYTPQKDMSKPEMIMALKSKYKNFFKLLESKLLEKVEEAKELSDNWKEKMGNNVHNLPEYEFRALRYSEIYGIVDYEVKDNIMTYIEEFPYEGTFEHKIDLDTMEQISAEQIGLGYMENIDGDDMPKYKEVIKSYNTTDYGYHNNSTTVYGELLDGNWYVFIPDNNALDIYDTVITDKFIDTLYNYDDVDAEDGLRDDEWYDNFQKEHNITDKYDSDKLDNLEIELNNRYFDMPAKMEENKDSTSLEIEYAIPNYTGGNIYNYTGKLKDGNYFMADDSYFNKDNFDITVVDTDPDKVEDDGAWYPDWQEEHLVEYLDETRAKEFTKQLLQWILTNKPNGNYDETDMKNMLDVITNTINENKEIEQHRNQKLDKLNADIRYDFEEAYKDWGKEVSDTKGGFVNEYMSEFCNDFDEVNWKDYIVAIPEVDKIYAQYKDTEDWEIPEDTKWELYELITDYVQDYLTNVYSKKTESVGINDNSVIVISYGRGTRFPDRETAIEYYKECVAGTDPNGAENYSYQNILYELMHTNKDVVYDTDDETEYDWWVQKGKPTDDISDELLKAHLGENKIMKKEDLSDEDIKGLDEYTDNEIKKMYDKYCSENNDKKSFEEWQKENVDSALINELEYEFFSNRKKTEDLDINNNGFVDQTLNDVLTFIGDGHDIADNVYDVEVFFALIDEPDTSDNYDLYIQGLSNTLKVVDAFDENDVNIIVNLTNYVTTNKAVLLDLFEVNGETDEEIMEDLVCRVMPLVISGYTTDSVYKILLNTVKGGK